VKSRSVDQISRMKHTAIAPWSGRFLFSVASLLTFFSTLPPAANTVAAAEMDCVVKIASSSASGPIYELMHDRQSILAASARGLFILDYRQNESTLALVNGTAGKTISFFSRVNEELYIAAHDGVYSYDATLRSATKIDPDVTTGMIRAITIAGDDIYVGADNGLYKLVNNMLSKTIINQKISFVGSVGSYTIASASDGSLYKLDNGTWHLLVKGVPVVYAAISHPKHPNTIVLGTEHGIFYLTGLNSQARIQPLDYVTPPFGIVMEVIPKNDEVLVGARTGLFRVDAGSVDSPLVTRQRSVRYNLSSDSEVFDTHLVYDLYNSNNLFLTASDEGLFKLSNNLLRYVESIEPTGPVFQIFKFDDHIILPAREGVYEYIVQKLSHESFRRIDKKSIVAGRNAEGIRVQADLGRCNDVASTVPVLWAIDDLSGIHKKGRGRYSGREGNAIFFDVTFDEFEVEQVGSYILTASILDYSGDFVQVANMPILITRDWSNLLMKIAASSSMLLFVLHFILYSYLIIAAPKQKWAFEILFDSRFGKGRLYFTEFLRRSRIIQLYIFSRFYKEQQIYWGSITNENYCPIPLLTEDESIASSDGVLNYLTLKKRVALLGSAGRGKTAALNYLFYQFYSNSTIWCAWKKHKFIVVPIKLRYLRRVEARDKAWLVRIVQLSLAEQGTPIEDNAIIECLLSSQFFAPCLDGLNEVEREQDLLIISKEFASLPILYTTRGGVVSGFSRLSLPINLSRYTSGILSALKGSAVSQRILEQADSSLLEEIQSGFEIWLLARVSERASDSPRRRLDLYESVVEQAYLVGVSEAMDRALSRCAWELWLKDDRNLGALGRFSPDEIFILANSDIIFLRGSNFVEFSHDQMRGFFAARWLVFHVHKTSMLQMALDGEDVWKAAPAVQTEMFTFFAEMLIEQWQKGVYSKEEVEQVGQYAVASDQRFVLQREMNRAAKRLNICIDVRLGS
jgi:hypothetical protein